MKLHNVIGGLEEKKNTLVGSPGLEFQKYSKITSGHNQLCNREVELDLDELAYQVYRLSIVNLASVGEETLRRSWKGYNRDYKEKFYEEAKAIAKAIEQGKVLKLTKEVENV